MKEAPTTLVATEVAQFVQGELHGATDLRFQAVKPLETAGPQDISFIASFEGKRGRFLETARASKAGLLLVPAPSSELPHPQIVVANPMAAVIQLSLTM